jgi:hypothetical protein
VFDAQPLQRDRLDVGDQHVALAIDAFSHQRRMNARPPGFDVVDIARCRRAVAVPRCP